MNVSPFQVPPQRSGHQRDWVWRGWQVRYSYLRASGDRGGCPIILLHGFGVGLGHWRENFSVLAQDRDVYALDLVGFGGSRKAFTHYNVNLWADQVYDFWKVFINRPVILVGNSLGSLVALGSAHRYADMVGGLIMISLPDPALEWQLTPKSLHPMISAIKNVFTSSLLIKPIFYLVRKPQIINKALLAAYPYNQKAVNDDLLDIIIKPTHDQGAADALCALTKSSIDPSYSPNIQEILPNLQVPILLLWGKKDQLIPPIFARKFAGLNNQIQLVELDNLGHCPHDEAPEIVNPILLTWLKDKFSDQ